MNTNHIPEPEYVDLEAEQPVRSSSGATTELTAPKQFDGLQFLPPDEIPDMSDEAVETGFSLVPQYYEGFLKEGDTVRAIYNGLTTIKSRKNVKPGEQAREISAIVFQNRDGVFLHSGANLVSQLRGFPTGKPIQIKYLGTEKTNTGNEVNKFEVRVLNPKPF